MCGWKALRALLDVYGGVRERRKDGWQFRDVRVAFATTLQPAAANCIVYLLNTAVPGVVSHYTEDFTD